MSDKDEYMKKLDDIQRDINWIIQYLIKRDEPIQPPYHIPESSSFTRCAKCGMNFQGVTGYYCSDSHCPTFFKTTM